MRSGVSFPAHGADATWALALGTPDADYPVANLADLSEPRRVFKASGALTITAVLAADQDVRFVGLLHHNAAGATMTVKLYSDAAMTALVHTSAAITLNDGDGLYPACTPYVLDAAVTARAVVLELDAGSWVIGAVEIAGFWAFEDVRVDRAIGVESRDVVSDGVDGADEAVKQWSPRLFTGSRLIDVTEEETTALDFQLEKGADTPFVWVWDYDDPTTWDRQCWIALDALSPLRKALHPSGEIQFRLTEHL